MNNKMAINTHLSTIESKKNYAEKKIKYRIMYTEHFDGCQIGERVGEWVKR